MIMHNVRVNRRIAVSDARTGFFFAAAFVALFWPASPATAAVTSTTLHGVTATEFDPLLSSSDLIHGRGTLDVDVFENPQDTFGNPAIGVDSWHPANTDLADHLPAFTDGIGVRPTGLTGLLNDNFPVEAASGRPAKIVEYVFDTPVDIGRINILTGNIVDPDGRIFSTTYIEYSTDNGFNYQPIGYFQSDPSGTVFNGDLPVEDQRSSTFVSVFDDSNATLVGGVTNLIFNLYSVSNTDGQMRDPFDGINPFTGVDDGIPAAFESPLVYEIDVLAPVEGQIGDHNEDGSVDAADYVAGRKLPGNFGGHPAWYNDWRTHFGEPASGGSAAVPEPSALLTLIPIAFVARVRSTRKLFGTAV